MKQISKKDFTEAVNQGDRVEDLEKKFGMTTAEVKKGMKQLGLKLKRKRKPTFEFVEAETATTLS